MKTKFLKYMKKTIMSGGMLCPICSEIDEGDQLILSCGHSICKNCFERSCEIILDGLRKGEREWGNDIHKKCVSCRLYIDINNIKKINKYNNNNLHSNKESFTSDRLELMERYEIPEQYRVIFDDENIEKYITAVRERISNNYNYPISQRLNINLNNVRDPERFEREIREELERNGNLNNNRRGIGRGGIGRENRNLEEIVREVLDRNMIINNNYPISRRLNINLNNVRDPEIFEREIREELERNGNLNNNRRGIGRGGIGRGGIGRGGIDRENRSLEEIIREVMDRNRIN